MTRRMLKTRVDVGFFEVGKVLEDLVRRDPAGKISSTWLTVIRTARIVGSAAHTSGLIVIGSICMRLFYKNLRERNLISITRFGPYVLKWFASYPMRSFRRFKNFRKRFERSKAVERSERLAFACFLIPHA